jgi:hypothetical protein
MASYKQTVLDIEDFIKLELGSIKYHLEKGYKSITPSQGENLKGQEDAYKAIQSIIKENGKETK